MSPNPGTHRAVLIEPLPDLSAWLDYFLAAEIPVLRSTAETLEALRLNEDLTDANSIGEMIAGDPLMTLKVLVHASNPRAERVVARAETATAALVMMGISPFFRAFSRQPTVDDRLASRPDARQGLESVLRRAHRSADFALAFSIQRTDPNAAAVHAAALLHEFAELLLWLHAPTLALRVEQVRNAHPGMRSVMAQQTILGIRLHELQSLLVLEWRLPTLLGNLGDRSTVGNPIGVRTVNLAASLARHTSLNWDNAAIPDDIHAIAVLMNMSPDAVLALARSVDSD